MAAFMFFGCYKDIWNEIDSLKAQINVLQVAQKDTIKKVIPAALS